MMSEATMRASSRDEPVIFWSQARRWRGFNGRPGDPSIRFSHLALPRQSGDEPDSETIRTHTGRRSIRGQAQGARQWDDPPS
jgi:hypothetical protein